MRSGPQKKTATKSAASAASQAHDYAADKLASAKAKGIAQKKILSRKKDELVGAATDKATSLYKKTKAAAGYPEEQSSGIGTAAGVTTGALACLALGMGAMYFLDPKQGRERRARFEDRVLSVGRHAGRQAQGYGQHLKNVSQGYVAQARAALPPDMQGRVDDAVGKAKSVISNAAGSAGFSPSNGADEPEVGRSGN